MGPPERFARSGVTGLVWRGGRSVRVLHRFSGGEPAPDLIRGGSRALARETEGASYVSTLAPPPTGDPVGPPPTSPTFVGEDCMPRAWRG
jgi:hypothetical protein